MSRMSASPPSPPSPSPKRPRSPNPKPEPKKATKQQQKKRKAPAGRDRVAEKAPQYVLTAATADKYELYQDAVQSPDHDVAFFAGLYRRKHGKPALHLREDFSGTGLLSATWVDRGPRYTAECFDIDPEPVRWGLENNVEPLGQKAAERIHFHLKDAREPSIIRRPDVRVALNFSFFIFKQRRDLLDYFRAVYDDLPPGGLFVLDTYGGPDAFHEMEETRQICNRVGTPFTYVWDQEEYWPATGAYKTHIHFRFRDGSEMHKAFSYDWRLWGLPELRDVLADAGFATVDSYWEGTSADGEGGNGVYRKNKRGENCMAWVTYVICWK